MKKILVLLSISFLNCAYANNTNIQIQSTALPAGMSQERYDQLFQAHAMNNKSNIANSQSATSPIPEAYAKADPAAKAYAAQKARAEAAAKAEAEAEAEAKAEAKAADESVNKKAEARYIASSAKRDFSNKIHAAWRVPAGSTGKTASARVVLTDSGEVVSIVVSASDAEVKKSIEQAVRSAAPYPMPSNPDARREVRTFTSSYTVK